MGFSSVAAWVAACQETQLPMWEVILRQDLDQDTPEARAASLKQMKHMWEVMKNSASQYQSEQRSYSGLVGGDGARYAEGMGIRNSDGGLLLECSHCHSIESE